MTAALAESRSTAAAEATTDRPGSGRRTSSGRGNRTGTRENGSVTDPQRPAGPLRRYLRRWRDLPRALGYLLVSLPIGIVSFVALLTGFVVGVSTAIFWVGFPILAATLLLAQRFGSFELLRLRRAGRPPIEAPDWPVRRARGSLWRRFVDIVADARTWGAWVHGLLVAFVLGLVTWIVAVAWLALSVGGVTYWFWGRYLPAEPGETWVHVTVLRAIPGYLPESTREGLLAGESVFYAAVGGILLVVLPLVVHGLVRIHEGAARLLLGESSSAVLRREIADSEVSRVSALLAEDDALRRLERDIHDGPQQSLLRVQYDLSSSLRALKDDDETVRPLLEGALALTKDTLQELRDLSRGMAPPLLQDRGLVSAVRSLASRNPVPTTTALDVPDDEASVGPIERSVYFVVSELLSNVAKHSGATAASVAIRTEVTGALLPRRRRTLVVEVIDNGRGGATETLGHGLSGLAARLTGLRGSLAVDSPAGGPTRITAALPLAGSALAGAAPAGSAPTGSTPPAPRPPVR
ncbi:hypothetical protein ASF54_09680 [Frondihabitans sp. Leaf304]|nr:hypothetical protein ASF54_09680 [Frondihabitans sp. Leaf304]